MSRGRDTGAAREDTLDRLLEAESSIERRFEECRIEAARLIDEARTAAARQEDLIEAKLQQERARRIRSREVEIVETTRAQRTRAAHEIKRLRNLSTERIDVIARKVLERLLPESPT